MGDFFSNLFEAAWWIVQVVIVIWLILRFLAAVSAVESIDRRLQLLSIDVQRLKDELSKKKDGE